MYCARLLPPCSARRGRSSGAAAVAQGGFQPAPHPRRRNLWPGQELPELRPAFRRLGQLVITVGQLLAAQCDAYVDRRTSARKVGRLRRIIAESPCPKVYAMPYYVIGPCAVISANR